MLLNANYHHSNLLEQDFYLQAYYRKEDDNFYPFPYYNTGKPTGSKGVYFAGSQQNFEVSGLKGLFSKQWDALKFTYGVDLDHERFNAEQKVFDQRLSSESGGLDLETASSAPRYPSYVVDGLSFYGQLDWKATDNLTLSGGAMIPLLSLGVPGDAVTAVLLGAFIIQGLQPGPMLYKEHIDIVYQIFASMMLAQFVMLFIGMAGIRLFAKVILVERAILTPAIFVLSMVGAFAMRSNIFDVYTTLAFGILGYVMMRYDYPLSPILLALILGPMAEANLRRAMVISSGDPSILFSRPIAVGLMVLAVVSLLLSIRGQKQVEARLSEMEKAFEKEVSD